MSWGCVRTCSALLTRQFPTWNITAVHRNSSQHGCTPTNNNILRSHIMAAEMCRLDFLQWPRTSPQHPTVFNILLRKTYLLLYDTLRNNSSVLIHKDFWSAKCSWRANAAGCLCLFRGHPLIVLFLTEIIWLLCSYGPSLKPPFLFKIGFLFPVSKEIRAKESKDKSELQTNYRPLSCASALGKLIEHIY